MHVWGLFCGVGFDGCDELFVVDGFEECLVEAHVVEVLLGVVFGVACACDAGYVGFLGVFVT